MLKKHCFMSGSMWLCISFKVFFIWLQCLYRSGQWSVRKCAGLWMLCTYGLIFKLKILYMMTGCFEPCMCVYFCSQYLVEISHQWLQNWFFKILERLRWMPNYILWFSRGVLGLELNPRPGSSLDQNHGTQRKGVWLLLCTIFPIWNGPWRFLFCLLVAECIPMGPSPQASSDPGLG